MHIEAMYYFMAKERVLEEDPNHLRSTIVWDGTILSSVWAGYRNAGKTYKYITKGLRWDAARHVGWIQFCLWMTRPSICFEFRGVEPRDAVNMGTWNALVECADCPWNNPTLREFWQKRHAGAEYL